MFVYYWPWVHGGFQIYFILVDSYWFAHNVPWYGLCGCDIAWLLMDVLDTTLCRSHSLNYSIIEVIGCDCIMRSDGHVNITVLVQVLHCVLFVL